MSIGDLIKYLFLFWQAIVFSSIRNFAKFPGIEIM